MSEAKVEFDTFDPLSGEATPGREQSFSFACPKGRRCGNLIIAGKTTLKWEPQGQNGGVPQWQWDGNREAPTFTPSINCKGCWHGYIRKGRCVDVAGKDEP